MTESISLLQALGAKMNYLDQRQKVLAQNIANADTPMYRPSDMKKTDFGRVLRNVTGERTIRVENTNAKHMPPASEAAVNDPKQGKSKDMYEVAPDNNGVILEEQMLKANQTNMDYNLMLNVYAKNMGMLRTAITSGGRN
ncbi:MAG: flagellar basal body rod protein FlgB [Alphaproteobacteria bacterium]|nr:flagellar basal body rod protein FlgB [Alphaproteobacteria bacterium]